MFDRVEIIDISHTSGIIEKFRRLENMTKIKFGVFRFAYEEEDSFIASENTERSSE